MLFKVGDLVTRKSHNHDMVFRIEKISDNIVYLKGFNVRLVADAPLEDLEICKGCEDDLKKDLKDYSLNTYIVNDTFEVYLVENSN